VRDDASGFFFAHPPQLTPLHMLLDFIAAIAAGLGAAGLMMGARFISGQRLPIYWVSGLAGIAMISMMVYLEYSWAERTIEQLPEGVVVTAESQETMWYRPWTYAKPLTLRLVAVDTRRNRQHAQQPEQVMTTVILLGRWLPIREIPVVYDCQNQRRADLSAEVTFADDVTLVGASWLELEENDRALAIACANMNS